MQNNKKRKQPMNSKSTATKRLLRDLREWKLCCHQAPSITAAPLENNIFEWHVNFCPQSGVLEDIYFHLIVTFPKNYPLSPPNVAVKNYMNHPNVFDNWICLNMLRPHQWSAAYAVSSVLMQLLSFLITDKAPQDYGPDVPVSHSSYDINKMRKESKSFECRRCGHSYYEPWPPLSGHEDPAANIITTILSKQANEITLGDFVTSKNKKNKKNKKHKKEKKQQKAEMEQNDDNKTNDENQVEQDSVNNVDKINYWEQTMNADVESIVIDFLTINELLTLSKISIAFKKMVNGSKYIQMERFSCWFHRISLRYAEYVRSNKCNLDDAVAKNLVLGYGIIPQFYANDKRIMSFYFNEFTSINSTMNFSMFEKCETTFDLLSSDAFKNHTIRRTPTNETKFTFFIPMYIENRYHGRKSLSSLKDFVLNIYKSHKTGSNNVDNYHPMMSIHLISTIMNSLIVSLMDAYKAEKLHYSIAALETFYHYYHLLLAVYFKHYDVLRPLIQQKCVNFVKNINFRSKKYVPNLGEFLIWLTLSQNIPSTHMFQALLEESFIRRVKWLLNDYGIAYEKQSEEKFDIQWSFNGSLTSLGLFMFQYYFLNECCGLGVKKPRHKLAEMNRNLGCVPADVSLKLQKFCYDMEKINNWPQFFNVINIRYPGDEIMKKWLKKSIDISAKRGYHRSLIKEEMAEKIHLSTPKFFKAVCTNNVNKVRNMLNIKKDEDDDKKIDDNDEELVVVQNLNKKQKNKKTVKWTTSEISVLNELIELKEKEGVEYEVIYDVNMTDINGRTPLFIAAHKCYLPMIKVLISANFNANVVDIYGKTAIKAALDGKNKQNANKMNQIIKLLKKQIKKQKKNELKENKLRNDTNNTFSSRFLRIYGLPYEVSKEDVKIIFKRYGFTSSINEHCIWFKKNHILIKLNDEVDIGEKMKIMNNGFCFGNKISVEMNRNNQSNVKSNKTLLCHGFDIIGGYDQVSMIKNELINLFPKAYEIIVGVNKFNDPFGMIKFQHLNDAEHAYRSSQGTMYNNNNKYMINNSLLKIEYAKENVVGRRSVLNSSAKRRSNKRNNRM